jgi:pimeloyl-ACP methyl ester carboxylesterase
MEDRKLSIRGIAIGFTRQGRGAPLVLIHGYPLDRSIWNPVVPLLEDGFDMIIPDLRGFGASEMLEADRSIEGYASDLTGLLESLQLGRAHVAGHSMGGYVALALVRDFPDRVQGLAMLASQTPEDSAERKAARLSSAGKIMREGVSGVVDAMVPELSKRSSVRDALRGVMSKQQPRALACALEAMAGRPDSTELWRSLELPVVIIHGDADELIPVQRGREMRAQLPAAHYVELAGVGHMPMMENAEAVAEAIQLLRARSAKTLNS